MAEDRVGEGEEVVGVVEEAEPAGTTAVDGLAKERGMAALRTGALREVEEVDGAVDVSLYRTYYIIHTCHPRLAQNPHTLLLFP